MSRFGRWAGGKAHARPDAEPRLGGGCVPRGRAGRALGSELVIEGVPGGGRRPKGRFGALRRFGGIGEGGARDWAARVGLRGERGCAGEPVAREGGMLCRSGGINFSDVWTF